MSDTNISLLAILLIFSYANVEGGIIQEEGQSYNVPGKPTGRIFHRSSMPWPPFAQSWSLLPTFPPLPSVSSLFKDYDDDLSTLKKRVGTLEKSQRELFSLVRKILIASETASGVNEKEPMQLSGNNEAEEESDRTQDNKHKAKPESGDVTSDKKESAIQNTKKEEGQSVSGVVKGDKTGASEAAEKGDKGTTVPTKTNEKEVVHAPLKKDQEKGNALAVENDQKEAVVPANTGEEKAAEPTLEDALNTEKSDSQRKNAEPDVPLMKGPIQSSTPGNSGIVSDNDDVKIPIT